MIKIKVPATSANVGVGFDCMGLAVSYYSTVSFEESATKLTITGCPTEFQNEDNLVYKAFVKGCDYLDKPVPNVKIDIESDVPVARGLGSSSVCVVAGLKAASVWFDNQISTDQLLVLATEMEGHPDNVTPAILGGLCVSFLDDHNQPQVIKYNVNDRLNFVALIPDYEVSTHEARKVLPKTMSYADAIHQVSRCAVMTKALEVGDMHLIHESCDDRMHEPYRAKLIPDYDQAKAISEASHGTMYISGSGSTMMAITPNEASADAIVKNARAAFPNWKIRKMAVDLAGVQSEVSERGKVLHR
ncbi:homoserine kinase [Lentilactobacillus parafarraginis F0439]|uniref:Homoserine kinase n=1 Tax=Lentilactobacillus parafarraginis F0439 TaxID=797515 RepID=G9ZNG4_9LACO|nr:homoserine kinase [Lentilactobacillus parafarraginis]EHL98945.1 homoserine kinase [Lentilactobacillus parafarraginis F0439]